MGVDLQEIRRLVRMEIDTYVIERPEGLVGTPLPDTFFVEGVQAMKDALVEPYWADAIAFGKHADAPATPYAVVSDDRLGYFLAFDVGTSAFVLLFKDSDGSLRASYVVGDAVGCFLSQ
jgi:hypothetical protein